MPYIGKEPADIIATAVDTTTGTFSGAVSAASVDADGGVTVDNITIDGTEIDLSSGDLTLDVAGDIILDADGSDIIFKDGGTDYGRIKQSSSDLIIRAGVQDKDIKLQGDDGGVAITALQLDMSEAGKATFNSSIVFGDGHSIGDTATDNLEIKSSSGENIHYDSGNGGHIFLKNGTEQFRIDDNNRVGIGTSGPSTLLHLRGTDGVSTLTVGNTTENTALTIRTSQDDRVVLRAEDGGTNRNFAFETGTTERMRISSGGNFMVGSTNTTPAQSNIAGAFSVRPTAQLEMSSNNTQCAFFNRTTDGTLIQFLHEGSSEGNIGISGSTVSFNGGHLARYSRLTNNKKDISIVKGTVMTNLDEMVVWSHKDTLWTEEDEPPKGVSVGDVKKPAYTEDNEQLNKMAVSSVEGDINVAGVFVSWDNDDDFNDMVVAMTGDMVIRIAKGTTVARGDLLMSAGDGTAKPQGDDIIRSKTIAKVTSTHKSHTYDDGTYLVPCVLMAC